MIEYQKVTEWNPTPEPVYPNKTVHLPVLADVGVGTFGHMDWVLNNYWMADYQVPLDKAAEARQLALTLQSLWDQHGDQQHEEIQAVLQQLRPLRAKNPDQWTAIEEWRHGAFIMTPYVSFAEIQDYIRRKLRVYKGLVLEAMCGHGSYFSKHKVRQIVALDFCKESLVRYPHGNAERICCDLDQLAKGESLSFFDSNMFDAVSVCFGYKYPEDIVSVMREFFRILKPGGSLLFFEAKGYEYPKYVKRDLDLGRFKAELMSVGFKSVRISLNRRYLPAMFMDQIDPIWHVRAVK